MLYLIGYYAGLGGPWPKRASRYAPARTLALFEKAGVVNRDMLIDMSIDMCVDMCVDMCTHRP